MSLTGEERAALAACPLLAGARPGSAERLCSADGVELAAFDAGEVVYSPRYFRRCLGIVLSGGLQVTKGSLSVSRLKPGELFGAAALYSDDPEFATTITARQRSRCLLLDQALVDRLLGEEPLLRRNYLGYLTGRVRFLSGRLQALAQPGAEGKLVRFLLANGAQGGVTCPAAQLAQRLGISRASLYRAFAALEQAGLITRSGKTIAISDPAGLEGIL